MPASFGGGGRFPFADLPPSRTRTQLELTAIISRICAPVKAVKVRLSAKLQLQRQFGILKTKLNFSIFSCLGRQKLVAALTPFPTRLGLLPRSTWQHSPRRVHPSQQLCARRSGHGCVITPSVKKIWMLTKLLQLKASSVNLSEIKQLSGISWKDAENGVVDPECAAWKNYAVSCATFVDILLC